MSECSGNKGQKEMDGREMSDRWEREAGNGRGALKQGHKRVERKMLGVTRRCEKRK